MMSDPVIYLDIDEVLNNYDDVLDIYDTKLREYKEYSSGAFVEVEKLNRLLALIKITNAKVVIVSSWANGRNENSIAEFLGITIHSNAFSTGGGTVRGDNVTLHRQYYGIDNYVVIDDSERMYTNEPNLISVDSKVGLSWKNVFDALAIFYRSFDS